ncbi:hypothetical protein [Methylobacterium mesophilicum]
MPVGTTNPRVTAADPGAWLDGEPWTFTLTFTDPDQTTPTDLTGSRLYVQFQAQGPAGLVAIQICDSAAGDGSLVIPTGTDGQATFNAVPEARTWTAPRYGPGLLLLPALVFGDVYRQVGAGEPVCLTRLTLRVLPTTGAPTGTLTPPIPPTLAALSLSAASGAAGSAFSATITGKTAGSQVTARWSDGTLLTVANGIASSTSVPAGATSIALTEVLAGAVGSPRVTTIPFTVTGGGTVPTSGVVDFSNPANSGLLAALGIGLPASTPTPSPGSALDFSTQANSGLVAAIGV